jgi:hypothetical protein
MALKLGILHEHPTWQQPLFDALDAAGVAYTRIDMKSVAFSPYDSPDFDLVFSQASPSGYVRGNGHAVAMAMSYLEQLEARGVTVLNGSAAFRLELSKITQLRLLQKLEMATPWTVAFNSVQGLREFQGAVQFPAILKPNQGGSGARMAVVNSLDHLQEIVDDDPSYWSPDPVLLLQEKLEPAEGAAGIVRMEFVGGKMLYAMRVLNTEGFNLCPSEDCNPVDGEGEFCAVPVAAPPEFYPYPDVPQAAIDEATRLFAATGFDVGGLEYMECSDGRRVFYDMNANSNLRRPIGLSMGFDPFERVAQYLQARLDQLNQA